MNGSITRERVHQFGGEYFVHLAQVLIGCVLLAGKFSLEAGAAVLIASGIGFAVAVVMAQRQQRRQVEKEAEQRRIEEERQNREARKALAKTLAKHFGRG